MIMTLSPSKGQDFNIPIESRLTSQADFIEQTNSLIHRLKQYDKDGIKKLMNISDNLATLNVERFKNFQFPLTLKNSKPALFAFKGDVYSGINKVLYTEKDLEYAQQHLRILSGLYGILRPMDLIQAYRLEMKTKLKTEKGDNLYQFWGDQLTLKLNEALKQQKEATLINLASNEYFKAIKIKQLKGRLIHIVFKEIKNDQARVIAIFAKRARGMMVDFILRQRIETAEDVKQFNMANYQYDAQASEKDKWVFSRPQP